jgi:hypothetical protein
VRPVLDAPRRLLLHATGPPVTEAGLFIIGVALVGLIVGELLHAWRRP